MIYHKKILHEEVCHEVVEWIEEYQSEELFWKQTSYYLIYKYSNSINLKAVVTLVVFRFEGTLTIPVSEPHVTLDQKNTTGKQVILPPRTILSSHTGAFFVTRECPMNV